MTGTTLRGVSLFSRSRTAHPDVFDIVVSPEGIEIRRAEGDVRLLVWDRVAAWEIEERKRALLLTLRGDGSVTPLIIPGWKLDDLDRLLRDVTAHLSRPLDPPPEPPDLGLPDAPPAEVAPEIDGSDLPPADPPAAGPMDLSLPARAAAATGPDPLPPMDLALPASDPGPVPAPPPIELEDRPEE